MVDRKEEIKFLNSQVDDEKLVITAMMNDEKVLESLMALKPECFSSRQFQKIALYLNDYFLGTNTAPKWEKVADKFSNDSSMEEIYLFRSKSWNYDPSSYDDVIKAAAILFNRERDERALKAIGTKDYDKIRAEELKVQKNKFSRMSEDSICDSLESEKIDPVFNITDFQCDGKGISNLFNRVSRDELVIFAGSTGTGKSWWLTWSAISAQKNGKNVLYYNLENDDHTFKNRYWKQQLFGLDIDADSEHQVEIKTFVPVDNGMFEIDTRTPTLKPIGQKKIKTLQANMKKFRYGELFMPSEKIEMGTLTPSMIREHIQELKINNVNIDVVVIDYDDVMKIDSKVSKKEGLDRMYQELENIAQHEHITLITASQTKQEFYNGKNKLGLDSLADSSGKARYASWVYLLDQTIEDKKNNLYGIKIGKCRGRGDWREFVVSSCLDGGRLVCDSCARELIQGVSLESFKFDDLEKEKLQERMNRKLDNPRNRIG